MRPRRGKHAFADKANDKEESKSKIENLEPPIINPIPMYDIGKESTPQFSFPRHERF